MDNVKSVLTSALNWAKANPWRAVGILALLIVWSTFMILPLWKFVKIVGIVALLGSFVFLFISSSAKKAGDEAAAKKYSAFFLVVLASGIFLFFQGVGMNPEAQSDSAKTAKIESNEKTENKDDAIISATNKALSDGYNERLKSFTQDPESSPWAGFVNKVEYHNGGVNGVKIYLNEHGMKLSKPEVYQVATKAQGFATGTITMLSNSDKKEFSKEDIEKFYDLNMTKDVFAVLVTDNGEEITRTSGWDSKFNEKDFQ